MALWKEAPAQTKEPAAATPEPTIRNEPENVGEMLSNARRPAPRDTRETRESVIGAEIAITGKIDGAGNVRLAGRFEGDVTIQGDLMIDAGAKLTGSVRAHTVIVAGEIEGNIENASRVELLATGVLNGDLKAGTLTVAAGSRMRGRSEFGWTEEAASKAPLTLGARQAS